MGDILGGPSFNARPAQIVTEVLGSIYKGDHLHRILTEDRDRIFSGGLAVINAAQKAAVLPPDVNNQIDWKIR